MSYLMEHAIIGSICMCLVLVFNYSLHRIEEGHVGVYYRVRSYLYIVKCILLNTIISREELYYRKQVNQVIT